MKKKNDFQVKIGILIIVVLSTYVLIDVYYHMREKILEKQTEELEKRRKKLPELWKQK